MKEIKILEINQEIEKTLTELCDLGLKKDGIIILSKINHLISSIQNKEIE